MARTCPDCDVPLERVEYSSCTHGVTLRVRDPDSDGVLSRLGIGGKRHLDAYLCPECRLVRFYA